MLSNVLTLSQEPVGLGLRLVGLGLRPLGRGPSLGPMDLNLGLEEGGLDYNTGISTVQYYSNTFS